MKTINIVLQMGKTSIQFQDVSRLGISKNLKKKKSKNEIFIIMDKNMHRMTSIVSGISIKMMTTFFEEIDRTQPMILPNNRTKGKYMVDIRIMRNSEYFSSFKIFPKFCNKIYYLFYNLTANLILSV